MSREPVVSSTRSASPVAVALVVVVALMALYVRYQDPLSSPVMATEDPYTHLVFTREHAERGHFADSDHMGTSMYPPGMHAFLAIFWGVSDVDPYAFMRLGAPLLGAIAVAGTFLLAARFAGLAAGVAAGVLVALMPEHVIRTNTFVPTAVDLALLPFLLWAVMEVVERSDAVDRRAWLAVAIVVGGALTVSHPWVVPLVALPLILYAGVRAAATRGRALTGRRVALVGAALVGLVLAAFRTRWKQSDSGFGDFLESVSVETALAAATAVFNVYFVAVVLAGTAGIAVLARAGRRRAAAFAASGTVLVATLITLPVLTAYPPALVEYADQLGWVAIGVAIAGLAVLPLWRDNRVGQLGAAIALVTFPLTAVNFFQSAFLPHRTVVYLSVGVALLGAGLVAFVSHKLTIPHGPASGALRRRGRTPNVAFASLAAVLLAGLMVSPVTAKPDPWYRYYDDDEFEGFLALRDIMREDPSAVALSGDWRPNMVLKSFAPELDRAWYSEEYFYDPASRGGWHARATDAGLTLYVVVDEYERQRFGDPGLDGALETVWACECGTLTVYRATGGGW